MYQLPYITSFCIPSYSGSSIQLSLLALMRQHSQPMRMMA